jgi:hypothetical protein
VRVRVVALLAKLHKVSFLVTRVEVLDEVIELTDRASGAACLVCFEAAVKLQWPSIVIDFHSEACGIFICLKACSVVVDLKVNGRGEWHIFVIIIQRFQPEQSLEKLGIVC